MAVYDIDLHVTDDALESIAQAAADRRFGARSLQEIVESIMEETNFVVPSLDDVNAVVVDKSAAQGLRNPLLLRGPVTITDYTRLAAEMPREGDGEVEEDYEGSSICDIDGIEEVYLGLDDIEAAM